MLFNKLKRYLSFLMAMFMLLSLMPVSVLAIDEEPHDHSLEVEEIVPDANKALTTDIVQADSVVTPSSALTNPEVARLKEMADEVYSTYLPAGVQTAEDVKAAVNEMDDLFCDEIRWTILFLEDEVMYAYNNGLISDAEAEYLYCSYPLMGALSDAVTPRAETAFPQGTVYKKVTAGSITIEENANRDIKEITNGYQLSCKASFWSSKTNTITFYNNLGANAILSFNYEGSGCSAVSVNGSTAHKGNISVEVAAGSKFTMSFSAKADGIGETISYMSITDISLVDASQSYQFTFDYDGSMGTVKLDGAIVEPNKAINVALTGGVCEAIPASGYVFVGWFNTDNTLVGQTTTYNMSVDATKTIRAVFTKDNPYFLNKSTNMAYDSWSGVLASMPNGGTAVLLNDATLHKGEYTIPKNVTLLLPYNLANTLVTNNHESVGALAQSSYAAATGPFRTLTMASGARLIVNGALSLSAVINSAPGGKPNVGSPTGKVPYIRMQDGSNITVNKGANLYCYGIITGSGTVTVESEANVYECFQLRDYRGGDGSSSIKNVFPSSQYYIQNVEVPMTIKKGGILRGVSCIQISYMVDNSPVYMNGIAVVGTSGSMFNLTDNNGYIVKRYDGSTDRLVIDINGNSSMTNIALDFGSYGASIDSKNYVLGINNNMTVNVNSGTATVNQRLALQPGAVLNIAFGAEVVLNKNLYVYDSDDWGEFVYGEAIKNGIDKPHSSYPSNQAANNYGAIPLEFAPGRTYNRTVADLVDAQINVNGTLTATAANIYTTAGGASIISNEGTGKVVLIAGEETTTQQADMKSDSTLKYHTIPITSAKLLNVNGTYTETNGATDEKGTTYEYCDKCLLWYTGTCSGTQCKCDHAYVGYSFENGQHWQVCTKCSEPTAKTNCAPGTAATCQATAVCGTCGNAYGSTVAHSYTVKGEVVAPTCLNAGYTVYGCSYGCGNSEQRDAVAATGHTWSAWNTTLEPNCTEAGSKNRSCACGATETESIAAVGHKYSGYITENGQHWQVCSTCTTPTTAVACSGGTASCTAKAVCSTCNVAYGPEPSHNYVGVTHNPTCVDKGYTVYTCSKCGNSYNGDEKDALGHNMTFTSAKAATCTVDGNVAYYTCGACSKYFEDEQGAKELTAAQLVVKAGHKMTKVDAVAETCTVDGNIAYYTCGTCSKYFEDEQGTKELTAEQIVVQAKHILTAHNGQAATCTEDGWNAYEACSRCEYTTYSIIPATGHTMVKGATTAPTCTNEGYTTYTCANNCGTTEKMDKVAATGHSYTSEETTAPTCTEKGVMTYTCACGDSYTEEIAAKGHTLTQVEAKAPTCTVAGYEAYEYCTVCDYTTFVEIPAKGHSYEAEVTAPTCVDKGYTTYTCSVCGDSYKADETAATGHSWVVGEADWSGTKDTGYTCSVTRTCACGENETATTTNINSSETKAPTCISAGETTYVAIFPDDQSWARVETATKVYRDIPVVDHTWDEGEVTAEAGCETTGTMNYTCTVDGCDATKEEEIAATGHTWVDADCDTPKTCSVCGATEGEATGKHTWIDGKCTVCNAECEHIWDEGVETKAPSETEEGEMTYTCTTCGETKTEVVPVTGPAVDEDLKFYSVSLSFQSQISIQPFVLQSAVAKAGYSDVYVMMNGKKVTEIDYSSLFVYDHQILATNMTQYFTFTLYGVKDGKVYKGETVTCSAESLALEKIADYEKSGKYAICTVLVDMLKYGAAAQAHFGSEFEPADANIGEYEKYATKEDPTLKNVNNVPAGVEPKPYTIGMSMQSMLEINCLYLGDLSAYEAIVEIEGENPVTYQFDTSTGFYVLRIPVGAKKVRSQCTVTLVDKITKVPVSESFICTAEGCAYDKVSASNTSSTQKALNKAVMKYGDAVIAAYG